VYVALINFMHDDIDELGLITAAMEVEPVFILCYLVVQRVC